MPWREVSVMDQRLELVRLAALEGANRRELFRRFGVSPTVGYKWLARHAAGDGGLADHSRRPHASPGRSAGVVEDAVLAVRDAHPAWAKRARAPDLRSRLGWQAEGARKIAAVLERDGLAIPVVSTVHAILRRHGRVGPVAGTSGTPYRRFEAEAPNLLWQMDFKGHAPLQGGAPCHPLTVVDNHSRFSPCLAACADERGATVRQHLETAFRRYGLPEALFVDNGGPWGGQLDEPWTKFTVWLLKLGIRVIRSRPYHPQSRGKNERFHRSLKAEVMAMKRWRTLKEAQHDFDIWRALYNHTRPHEALGQKPPISRYRPSQRPMPDNVAAPLYDTGEITRRVSSTKAYVSFKGRLWKVPQAFCGETLAIRPLTTDGSYGVFFAAHPVATINLTNRSPVSHVSEQVSAISPV